MDSLWFGVNTVTLGKIYYVSSDHGNKWQKERMNQHDIYANVQNKSGWQIWHKKQLSLYIVKTNLCYLIWEYFKLF